jgi:hypothetical protein
MLEPVQEELLSKLVHAARALKSGERHTFTVTSELGKSTLDVWHPGLGEEALDAYRTDLRVLEDEGYIVVHVRREWGAAELDVSPRGFQRVENPAIAAAVGPQRKRWGRWVAVDERPIKSSAMGVIWRVRDEQNADAPWRALKQMKYSKGRGSAAYRRFVREIQTLAENLRERHPNIIEVLDYSVPAEGDTSDPYMVMPLAHSSLGEAKKLLAGEVGPVLRLLIPIADALHAAHGAGVIHRDVKPENVLLFDEERRPVLCDFGIAYLEDDERLTRVQANTVGTDDFVAPELEGGGRSEAVTRAADVYSFGKTLFAVVSGGDVFPRERWDDERYDLVSRFGREELSHVRGLMQVLVVEDPAARPQSMAEVKVLLERALANVHIREPFRDGMYGGGDSATERLERLRRVLGQALSVARTDALRRAAEESTAAADALAREYAGRPSRAGFQVGGGVHESATVAAAAAEHLMSVGLPLVEADERDAFEEWLIEATAPASRHDGYQFAHERMILSLAGVLAAHAAAALAWRRRRLEMVRLVVDRYAAGGEAWIHHTALGDRASALVPWMTGALKESPVFRRADAGVAANPEEPVAFVGGLAVLRFLAVADEKRVRAFLAQPAGLDFPVPFAPGLIDPSWVSILFDIGSKGGPLERDLARKIFDMTQEELRAHIGRLSSFLSVASVQASQRSGGWPTYGLGVDAGRWQEWCGGRI